MNPKKLIDLSYCPNPTTLEALSVKIECLNKEKDISNNGTGTLFSSDGSFFVITAAHCIEDGETTNHVDKRDIRISLPRISKAVIEVREILDFNLEEKYDFALMSVNFNSDCFHNDFDYENRIKFIGKDEFGLNTCIYGYTSSEPIGRLFRTHMVSSDTYTIEDSISPTGAEFSRVMKGSSGGGVFVEYEDCIYCLGYVKSRMTDTDRLDDIKIRRIPDINKKLGGFAWLPSILQNQVVGRSIAGRSGIEIDYINKWSELSRKLSNNDEANKILDEIADLRKKYPYVKIIVNQENVINSLLRKDEQWSAWEQRAFIYALKDRGLWPALYGQLPRAGNLLDVPETKFMMLRNSTFTCSMQDGDFVLDSNTDEGRYELILREAYKFEFDTMYELVKTWEPTGTWVTKKAFLMNLFEKNEDSLVPVKKFIENKENNESDRFVATLIYNVVCQEFPQPFKYNEFWKDGVESPDNVIYS